MVFRLSTTGPLPEAEGAAFGDEFAPSRSRDPLWLAAIIALSVHAFVILAISFDIARERPPAPERTLDITLVQPKTVPQEAEKPDFPGPEYPGGRR